MMNMNMLVHGAKNDFDVQFLISDFFSFVMKRTKHSTLEVLRSMTCFSYILLTQDVNRINRYMKFCRNESVKISNE